jgi:hypothetical protein
MLYGSRSAGAVEDRRLLVGEQRTSMIKRVL